MKVYVITQGLYSDYHIVGVKLTREEAEKVVALGNDERLETIGGDMQVEEFDTDNIKIESENTVKDKWECTFDYKTLECCRAYWRGETLLNINHIYTDERYSSNRLCEHIIVNASFSKDISEEKVEKIMRDRAAKFKAEREGL